MSQTENQRKGIFLYFNYAEYFDLLSMKERGELFTALMEGEEVPDMSKAAKIAFRFMHAQALRDAEKSMTNSINGRKGGRVKSSEGEPKAEEGEIEANGSQVEANPSETQANGSEVEANPSEAQANGSESKPNKDKNENEDENEKDTFPSAYDAEAAPLREAAPPEQVGGARKESLSQKSLEKEFNEIWELYPRKAGRKDALNAFVRARKKGVSYATIEDGVKEYARVCRTRDPQYIKYGSSWFTGEGWNDRELEVRGYDESAIPSEYAEACAGYTF